MEESEDNMSSDCATNLDSSLTANSKSKKRSLVERELETSLTARITSPAMTEGSSTSRYGRARRLKTDTDFCDTDKAVSMAMKVPNQTTNLVKTPIKSPHAYKMHAVNSPLSLENSHSSMSKENTIENQIENIYNANNSLSRFGSEEKVSKSPAKKFPKVYVRKDLIQSKEKEETLTLIKNMFSPVKSSNKRSNTHLNNILERSSEKYNINGAAHEQNGFIDTPSVVKTLDFDGTGKDKVPKKSKDYQDNRVILSKGELFELEAKCEYQVGDCTWARIGTFPFWPCIVTREPGSDMFVKKKLFGRVERDVIHVTFFGDNGRRSWVLDSLLRPFLGLAEFESAREQYTAEAKKKDPRLYAAFFVSDKKQSLWKASVEEAETLFKEPKRLRIDLFYDLLEKSRIQKITPKGQKSGKITRTDSDVSLSESLYDSLFSEDDGKVDDLDRSKPKKNKPLDVSEVVTACLDNMAAKTGMTKIQKQSHMDIWLQKAKSKTPEKSQIQVTISVETVDEKIENMKENDRKNKDKKKNKVISKEVPVQKPYRLRKSVAESPNLPSNHKNNEIESTFQNHIELLNANLKETNTTEYKSDNNFQGNINNEPNFDPVVSNILSLRDAEDQDIENDLKSKDKSLLKSSNNVRNKSVKIKVKGRRLTANHNLKNKVLESTEEQMLSDELKLTSEIELERSNNWNDDSKSVSLEPVSSENLIKDGAAPHKNKVLKKSKVARVKKDKKKVSRKKKHLDQVASADNEALKNQDKAVREVTPLDNEILNKHDITKDNLAPSVNESVDCLIMVDKADSEMENPPKNVLSKDMADLPKEDMNTPNISTDKVIEALDNLIFCEDRKATEDVSCNISKSFSDKGNFDDQNLATEKADTTEFKDLDNNNMCKVKKVPSDNTATANCNVDVDTTAVSESTSLDNENFAIGETGSCEHEDLDESILSKDKAARSKDTDNCNINTNKAAPSEKFNDPKFQRYVELKQDAIIDQHPQLTYDEIVEYLFNTWLYEQGLKNNDKNKNPDICNVDTDKAALCANGSHDNQYVNENKSSYSLIETTENAIIALDKIVHPENEKKNNNTAMDMSVEFVFGDDDKITNHRDPESELENQTYNTSSKNIEQIDKDKTVNHISLENDTIKSECNDDSTYELNLAHRKKSKKVNKDKHKKISLALRKSPRSAPRLDSSFGTDNKQGTYCQNNIPNEMNEINLFPKETVGDCSLSSEKDDQTENLTKSLVYDEAVTENRTILVEEESHNTTELSNPETNKKLSDINTVTDCIEIESDDDDMKYDMDIETASINSAISDISITENEKLAFKTGAPAIIVNGFHGNDFVRKIKEEKLNDSDMVSMSSECDNLALSELKLRSQVKDEKIEVSNDIKNETPLGVSDTDNEPLIPKDSETNFNDVKKVSKVVLHRIEDQVNDNSLSPRTRRILRPRMCNSPADVLKENESQDSKSSSPEPKIKDEFDPDTISINSEDSNASSVRRKIRKDKEATIKEEKLKDPEFQTYIELKQDALMDQHPELTNDEIVEYLFKTWLYEQGLKKNDDIDHSTLVKGSNEELTQAKPLKKKIKTEKKANTKSTKEPRKITDYMEVSPKDKPKRKVSQPFYAEDCSDIEEEIQLFEIFRKHAKPDSKSTEIKSVESIKVESNIETSKESSCSKIYSPKVPKLEPTTVQNGEIPGECYDEEELYFEQLTQPKPNVFRGLSREKVCEICEKTSNLVKCKGCSGMFHGECVTKAQRVIEISPPTRGRKKKKKGRGRKLKLSTDSNGLDSESQSDEKSQDPNVSKDTSMDDPDCYIVLDADNFESKLEEKMKELLETKEDITFDSYSSDEALDWNDTETGKCEIVDIKLKEQPVDNTDYSDFKCNDCQKHDTPICFVCKSALSPKNKAEMRQRCQVLHCNKYYHLECLDHWPQTQFNTGDASKNNKKNEIQEAVTCPRHVCHTCVCDDPRGCKTRFSGDKLARCIRCPATYHTFTKCLPAGTQILTGSLIICPRHYEHRPGKVPCHVNTGWCFICALGGSLICCEYCPTSFHAECLKIAPPDGGYMCEDCETGRLPLYGEMVWVKLGHYRWWPGIVLHPTEIPANILAVKHSLGEFVVRFFGQYDYYWVNRGRVFPFQEGDSGRISSQKSKIDEAFTKAMDHAQRAFEILKNLEPNEEESLDIASSLLPPSYVKLKANKPCGALVGRRSDVEESSLTQCECNPTEPEPCGPYSQCLNRMLLTECGPSCRAGDRCQNRAFERREYPPLRPYRTPHRGWGLRTLADIKAGQFVIEYVGELIDEEEFRRRMNRKHEMRDENFYFLTLDKERMIDAGPKGNLARFMNHCCEPNCETQKWTVLGDVRVGLFAINDIPANSEVTFNYNLECAGIDKKRCLCGAKRCSGYIGAKLKQDDPLPKKPKVPVKRAYKKRKTVEDSPSTSKNKPKRPVGRPAKPRELTEIEKDLLIIKNATNGISSDSECSGRLSSVDVESEKKDAQALKRKRVSHSTEDKDKVPETTPLVKKLKVDSTSVCD